MRTPIRNAQPETTRGERLRVALEAAGISQGELARRLGTTRPSITQRLNGRREPSLDWLLRAALAAGIDPAEVAPGVLASNKGNG